MMTRTSECNDPSPSLRDEGAGSCALVLPVGRHDADGLVVSGKAVNSGLDQNKSELGVLVLSVALEVLSDGNSLCQQFFELLHSERGKQEILPS
jgi:hypothetical protein